MDYCDPCRRHLNGALACAGCGTPAEALSPFTVPAPTPAGRAPGAPDEAAAPVPAARSRRRARGGHRRRGRTALLAAGGLVLAAGALSLAELAAEPDRGGVAADFVREAPRAPEDSAPDSSSGEAPRDPGPLPSRTGVASGPSPDAAPTRDAPTGEPSGGASDAPGPEASPATAPPAESPDPGPDPDGAGPSGDPGTAPADPPDPDGPAAPPTAPAPPPPDEPTQAPAPTPTPSPTCTRFLWWCA
ncbi:SCO2400 family protein [Streptomyces sp. NPDC012600]|uniref:SCO2400 family protein n=1 Tax=Streptomyces sp. NPDC012600 TaxID=3415005 RepID=UPI003C2AC94C